MDQKEFDIRWLLKECSEKYSDLKINLMKIDLIGEPETKYKYRTFYKKNMPHMEKYCGPDTLLDISLIDADKKYIVEKTASRAALFSKKPLVLIENDNISYYETDLKPYIHYIPVKSDESDLVRQSIWILANYEASLKIAEAAYEYATIHFTKFTKDKLLDRVYDIYIKIQNEIDATSTYYTNAVKMAIGNADHLISKLEETAEPIKHFYNNLCFMNDPKYLEVGTWESSSLPYAMYKNIGTFTCLHAVNDDDVTRINFFKKIKKYKGENKPFFIEGSYFQVNLNSMVKSTIFIYSGEHTVDAAQKVLKYYLSALDDIFILVLNDWNCSHTRTGVKQILSELKIVYEITKPSWDNGIYIAVVMS